MANSITDKDLLYKVALTLLPDVGDVIAKNLVTHCGSAEAVFKEKKKALIKIPGIADKTAENILAELKKSEIIKRAEQEIQFIGDNLIEAIFFTDKNYPSRLKFSNDSPALLYYKGNADLNTAKVVSVVGTRTPSSYGISITEQFIDELSDSGILIVSGLAYGIDVLAHKTALEKRLDTIGVVAHGLDRIYPSVHGNIARKMEIQGGILTDFISETKPDRENFPKRNRIVAGMCDALVIVETKLKGGSLITAEIANSYNKDVFAFPGRTGDEFSAGCNAFIKRNKAVLIENAADLLYVMNWQTGSPDSEKNRNKQIPLLPNLSTKEQKIVSLFSTNSGIHIDELCYKTGLTMSDVASTLLQLEFSNVVKSLPGKMYSLL